MQAQDLLDDMATVKELQVETNTCYWLSCFRPRYGDNLCKYHMEIITCEIKKKQKAKKTSKLYKLKPKTTEYKQQTCAAKRCMKIPSIDSNLCLDHETAIDHIKPKKEFTCIRNDCGHVVVYNKRYCIEHL